MSCNPAIGGVAKGQLVREIDALGGFMGLGADACGIHFRMLNTSRGAAVWGPRAQQDMDAYSRWMRARLEATPRLELWEGEVGQILSEGDGWRLPLEDGREICCRSLVVTTGTFAGGLLYRGEERWEGGRIGEAPAKAISRGLAALGLSLRRLKTGTPSRLRRASIDWSLTDTQPGDECPWPFSFRTIEPVRNQALCHIVRTSARTHELLREGFARSPLFTGKIVGAGPRYCPSIEDKVSRFPERDSHQLFLEPEGLENDRIYVNGFSSSLPAEVQDAALRSIPALSNCEVIRYGYAVEYDAVDATELHPTLESRRHPGLFLAGQTNGTSGYEEAAGQGLAAGANAALHALRRPPLLLDRATSYLGVMLDDLTGLRRPDPYRLFTSRAEFRLHLRADNAEERLMPIGHALGLVDDETWERFRARRAACEGLRQKLSASRVRPEDAAEWLAKRGDPPLAQTVPGIELARRPEAKLAEVCAVAGLSEEQASLGRAGALFLQSDIAYEGFKVREARDLDRVRRLSGALLPRGIDWLKAEGLSIEAREALQRERPLTVGQAARLPGVRPADVAVLQLHLTSH
jgi:tRNA uridine 5-carboxymethylaminomethyl modification enzyme